MKPEAIRIMELAPELTPGHEGTMLLRVSPDCRLAPEVDPKGGGQDPVDVGPKPISGHDSEKAQHLQTIFDRSNTSMLTIFISIYT